jgi:transcriptional regulator with XRE-family HTH domain
MGRSRRPGPKRLADKLHAIRMYYHLTQAELIRKLGYIESPVYPGHISGYELQKREPPMLLVLQYARFAQLPMEVLVDDRMDLPLELQFHCQLAAQQRRQQQEKAKTKAPQKRLRKGKPAPK